MSKKTPYRLEPLPEAHDFSAMAYSKLGGQAIGVIDAEDTIIAYLWYELKDSTLSMDMIEVLEKEQGHGTAIVRFLFDELPIDQITGTVMYDYTLRAYYFWLNLGAWIDVQDEDDYLSCCREGYDVSFSLEREAVQGKVVHAG